MKCSYWIHEIEQWMESSWKNESAAPPIPKPLLFHAETCPLCAARIEAAKQMAGDSTYSSSGYYAEHETEAAARVLAHVMKHVSLSNSQDVSYGTDASSSSTNIRDFQDKSAFRDSGDDKGKSRLFPLWKKRAAAAAAAVVLFTAGILFAYFFPSNRSDEYITVHLIATVPYAQQVAVAGDWNSWNPTTHQMQKKQNGDTWEIIFRVVPDREYRYQLVIDGEQWIPDPGSHLQVEDGFGGINSILEI